MWGLEPVSGPSESAKVHVMKRQGLGFDFKAPFHGLVQAWMSKASQSVFTTPQSQFFWPPWLSTAVSLSSEPHLSDESEVSYFLLTLWRKHEKNVPPKLCCLSTLLSDYLWYVWHWKQHFRQELELVTRFSSYLIISLSCTGMLTEMICHNRALKKILRRCRSSPGFKVWTSLVHAWKCGP